MAKQIRYESLLRLGETWNRQRGGSVWKCVCVHGDLWIHALLQSACFLGLNSINLTFSLCDWNFRVAAEPGLLQILKCRPRLPRCLCPQHTCDSMFAWTLPISRTGIHWDVINLLQLNETSQYFLYFYFMLFIFTSRDLAEHSYRWRCRAACMLASKMSHFLYLIKQISHWKLQWDIYLRYLTHSMTKNEKSFYVLNVINITATNF